MIAQILRKRPVAKKTLRVEFKLPKAVSFKAGQYTTITLLNPPYNDALGLTRDFSLVNPPQENEIFAITTRLRDTAFKKSLAELPEGTKVEVREPVGDLVLPEFLQEPLVFIAGGIGVTPFISMLNDLASRNAKIPISLLLSNRDLASAPYLDDIDALTKRLPEFSPILTVTQDKNWHGEKGRINAEFLDKNISNLDSPIYYVTGSPAMVRDIFDALISLGVNPMKIKSEDFAGY